MIKKSTHARKNRIIYISILAIKFISVFLASCLIWDFIIGSFIQTYPQTKEHPLYGLIPREGEKIVWGTEGYGIGIINNYGLLGENIEDKKNGEFRILVLGDSYTEALQVMPEQKYVYLLEKKLTDLGYKVTVINAGKGDNSVADHLYFADYYKKEFNPDYVVIQTNLKDFTEDATKTTKHQRCFLNKDKSGNIIINAPKNLSKTQLLLNDFRQKSAISNFIVLRSLQMQLNIKFRKLINVIHVFADTDKKSIEQEQYLKYSIENLKKAYGTNMLILYLDSVPIAYKSSMITYNLEDEDYKKHLTMICDQNKINVIDTKTEFINSYKNNNISVRGFSNYRPSYYGHLNKFGHEVLADKLFNYFVNILKGDKK